MLNQIKDVAIFAVHDWRNFLRTRFFRIGGIAVPLVIAVLSWFIILYFPSSTADGTNKWEYFQSELQRYSDELKGTYAFELADDRFVFYVEDTSNLDFAEAIRQEILRRDIAVFIQFINEDPKALWSSWFSGTDLDLTHHSLLLTDSASLTAKEFIEKYALKHDSQRSYLLATTKDTFSWFVDGWNQHYQEIAEKIPAISFAKHVEIFDANDMWQATGVFKGYFKLYESSDEPFGQTDFFINDPEFYLDSKETRDWYRDVANAAIHEQFQSFLIGESFDEFSPPDMSIVTGLTTHATVKIRSSETKELRKQVYLFVFMSALIGGLCLLFFDRNLVKSENAIQSITSNLIDSRVLGMTLKVGTVLGIWFVLLISSGFALIGSNPSLGAGALGLFFHPLFVLHSWLFLLVGLVGFGYVFHLFSLIKGFVQVFPLTVLLCIMAKEMTFLSSGFVVGLCFLPFIGPYAAVGLTSELPEFPMYLSILLVSLLNLSLLRILCGFAERKSQERGELKYAYQFSS